MKNLMLGLFFVYFMANCISAFAITHPDNVVFTIAIDAQGYPLFSPTIADIAPSAEGGDYDTINLTCQVQNDQSLHGGTVTVKYNYSINGTKTQGRLDVTSSSNIPEQAVCYNVDKNAPLGTFTVKPTSTSTGITNDTKISCIAQVGGTAEPGNCKNLNGK